MVIWRGEPSRLQIDRQIGYRQSEAAALGNLGLSYADLGELPKAIEYLQQALDIHRQIGYHQGEASQLNNLGVAYRDLGKREKALACFQQALDIFEAIGLPRESEIVTLRLSSPPLLSTFRERG